jgi:predicted transcriptional regulator
LITVEEETATYVPTKVERDAIHEALNDVEQGNVVSSEKANEMIKGWLDK